jgi:hypothetical protein
LGTQVVALEALVVYDLTEKGLSVLLTFLDRRARSRSHFDLLPRNNFTNLLKLTRMRIGFSKIPSSAMCEISFVHLPCRFLSAPVQVTLVAQVVSVQKQATNCVYQLDDGTGPMLEARHWSDSINPEGEDGQDEVR